jgi:hypothetical protein
MGTCAVQAPLAEVRKARGKERILNVRKILISNDI